MTGNMYDEFEEVDGLEVKWSDWEEAYKSAQERIELEKYWKAVFSDNDNGIGVKKIWISKKEKKNFRDN